MRRPAYVLAMLALPVFVAPLSRSRAAATDEGRPNFIIINIDDMGYADVGAFGSELNRTPNIDRLANEGKKFTSFYAAPVCSPSRAALMTGCYPKRSLSIPHVLFPGNEVGLDPSEITIADLLKTRDYATGIIGKWHLGDQPEFLPRKQGFDYYFGLPYSNDMGPAKDGVKSSLGDPIPTKVRRNPQPPLPLMRNETVLQRVLATDQVRLVEMYTEEAVRFIREHRQHPFFLYLPHSAVHFPIYPGKKFQGRSPHGYYSDWVEEVDWSVGQVLDAVRQSGLSEQTLVVFTSDNGGTKRAVNDPLRGFKGSTFEGGIRVPMIAWWPGKIRPGTSSDAITGMFDMLPTLGRLAGAKLPDDRKLDGADLWPILSDQPDAKPPHDTFYYFRGLKLEAVRVGSWKLRLAKNELYNLAADIGESTNVAAQNPEVVKGLRQAVAEMDRDLGLTELGPGCRPLGRVVDARPIIGLDGKTRPIK